MDITKLQTSILIDLQSRGFELDEIEQITPEEAFDELCNWNGLLGWGPTLRGIMSNLQDASRPCPRNP